MQERLQLPLHPQKVRQLGQCPSLILNCDLVQPQPTLTTEYTPIQRDSSSSSLTSSATSSQGISPSNTLANLAPPPNTEPVEPIDPATLPPVKAPPSHPTIDPNAPGNYDGRAIFEHDINSMAEKPWRRPGSDISEYFNYGFDEISWEMYCYRRRDLGEMVNVLKTNVLVRFCLSIILLWALIMRRIFPACQRIRSFSYLPR